jgi:hypothetical protein
VSIPASYAPPMRPGRFLFSLGVCLALLATSCGDADGEGRAEPDPEPDTDAGTEETVDDGDDGDDGFADPAWFAGRQDDYLAFATEELDPESILNVVAHAERAEREPDFTWDSEEVTPESFSRSLDKIRDWIDTSDFDALYFVNLLYGYREKIPEATTEAIEEALLGYAYWYTEPVPNGVVDLKYYWSENHRIIFHAIEFLMGQAHPDATFTNDGRTGAEHRDEARERILRWIDEKVDVGFSEWHSDVYYQKTVTPLLTLVEWADDEEIATRAAMVLDLVLFDMALHVHEGNMGVTHGRSYMKDKSKATDQDVFGINKLLFDQTDQSYVSRGDAGATLLARAERYRLPEVIRSVAAHDGTMIDRERMSVPLDPTEPVHDDPEAPYGYDFSDPDNLDFWWERGAQPAWQVAPLTIDAVNTYDLWETPTFAPFQPLRDAVGDDVEAAQALLQSLAPILSFALLNEANTVTYRSPAAMLSTVVDFRPGTYSDQHHVWQATLDDEAVVFTTHPKNEPFEGADSWPDADGYWTGSGSLPRAVQHGATGISLYAPRVPAQGALEGFDHLPFTHAWFPTERFDEVVRDGNWTFGRRGDGFVGLWSWREPEWRTYEAGEVFTDGLTEPFDLVAPGGPDNAWIVQVGDAGEGDFATFQESLRSAAIDVQARTETDDGFPGGFDVTFESPTEGEMVVGQDGPFTVDGDEVPLRHELRYDNPWASVEFQSEVYEISDDQSSLELDFGTSTRSAGTAR